MYATEKSLSELDGIVDNLFIDLVFYSALSKMSTEMLLAGGWRAGAYSVNAVSYTHLSEKNGTSLTWVCLWAFQMF